MTSSCGLGFAHDVDTQSSASIVARTQRRTVLALPTQTTDSLLHILVLYCSCLKYGRPRNSEPQVGHIDRTLASTNEVSNRFCPILECFSCS